MMWANIGIPMICFSVPTMLFALLPIAAIETWILVRHVGLSLEEAWSGSWRANLISTVVGLPIAWMPLVAAQMAIGGGQAWGLDTPLDRLAAVTLQAPWLIPYHDQQGWMVPAASLVLLVPFYFASVIVEYLILRTRWGEKRRGLLAAVFWANAMSYLVLGAFYSGQLALAWPRSIAGE